MEFWHSLLCHCATTLPALLPCAWGASIAVQAHTARMSVFCPLSVYTWLIGVSNLILCQPQFQAGIWGGCPSDEPLIHTLPLDPPRFGSLVCPDLSARLLLTSFAARTSYFERWVGSQASQALSRRTVSLLAYRGE